MKPIVIVTQNGSEHAIPCLADHIEGLCKDEQGLLHLLYVQAPIPAQFLQLPSIQSMEASLLEEGCLEMKAFGEQLGIPAERQHFRIGLSAVEARRLSRSLGAELFVDDDLEEHRVQDTRESFYFISDRHLACHHKKWGENNGSSPN